MVENAVGYNNIGNIQVGIKQGFYPIIRYQKYINFRATITMIIYVLICGEGLKRCPSFY